MFKLLQRSIDHAGTVHFRGNLAPRAEEFSYLEHKGFSIKPEPAKGGHWHLKLKHPKLGEADLVCLRDMPVPGRELLAYSGNLTRREKEEAAAAGPGVSVRLRSSRGSVLRDRKSLLKMLRLVMGDDGVIAADHGSQIFWSRAALDDELSAPGEPDVSVLYCVHAVTESDPGSDEQAEDAPPPRASWLHTHGLEHVGAFNFDVLHPSESLGYDHADLFRAAALAAIEGTMTLDMREFALLMPGGVVRPVSARTFLKTATSEDRRVMDHDDADLDHRAVLCDPQGFLGRLLGGARPSRFLQTVEPDQCVVPFSKDATEMMAERARATLPLLRSIREELLAMELPTLVKLHYPTDRDPSMGEYLWFEVHDLRPDGSIDATLVNEPHDIAAMKAGERGLHPAEKLTDWAIMSPLGKIDPANRRALRQIREDPEAVQMFIKTMKMMQGPSDGGEDAER